LKRRQHLKGRRWYCQSRYKTWSVLQADIPDRQMGTSRAAAKGLRSLTACNIRVI
jgi:hypothetical protein